MVVKKHVLKIPATFNCEMVFSEFLQHEKHTNSIHLANGASLDMVSGLRAYFNHRFVVELLYKGELAQVKGYSETKTLFSELFGCEHLLRLMTCIGRMISGKEFSDMGFVVLQEHFQRLVDFIELYKDKYLSADNYVPMQP